MPIVIATAIAAVLAHLADWTSGVLKRVFQVLATMSAVVAIVLLFLLR